jgi:hypothetical protein
LDGLFNSPLVSFNDGTSDDSMFGVYLTGGFKRPRERVTGVTMAVCTVSFGVTGYSLPWDQVGYWAVKTEEFQMLFQLLDQQLVYIVLVLVNLLVFWFTLLFYLY